MAPTPATPATSYAVERSRLRNGLRVVLAPDRSAPVVAVAVYYDVGIRSEPEGRTGFAHLFEHLMFQGSASLEKMEHVKYVQASGGTLNGSTRLDYTNYYEALPSHALDRALFLEADRMRSPAVTEENLANQIAVVKEEIRVNVLNQPYGGFEDLESATVDDAQDFFDRYYAPGNAVLVVGGDLDTTDAMGLVERHFGDVPARAVPARPDFDEPAPTSEKRGEQVDPQAPAPALALAWRTPDPADLAAYLPFVVLSSALATGDASRLRRRLMHEDSLATDVGTHIGVMQDPFDVRNPTIFTIEAHHSGDVAADRVVAAADEELDKVATDGVDRAEVERVQARLESAILQGSDHVLARTLSMAAFEQQRGRAELVGEIAGLVAEVTPEQVQAAAATLTPDARARLDLVAGAT